MTDRPPASRWERGLGDGRRAVRATWATIRPRVPAGDEPHSLVIAQSLLRDADVRIENSHRQEPGNRWADRLDSRAGQRGGRPRRSRWLGGYLTWP
jgi:hypothetical protein